ncbi:hypothetical protein NQ318_000961 [Aromia moschata]|uniref:Secreted protein n=1 Tax=Aromia moschata TaxID=1265417 RepID=A0AAV8ZDN6_9CUCU|nr:hypothetical protein NQ318_000961 [Aromia moschata]
MNLNTFNWGMPQYATILSWLLLSFGRLTALSTQICFIRALPSASFGVLLQCFSCWICTNFFICPRSVVFVILRAGFKPPYGVAETFLDSSSVSSFPGMPLRPGLTMYCVHNYCLSERLFDVIEKVVWGTNIAAIGP